MRLLLILLVLVNLGFFAYHRFLNETVDASAQIAALQISPEKIRPVAATATSAVATTARPLRQLCRRRPRVWNGGR